MGSVNRNYIREKASLNHNLAKELPWLLIKGMTLFLSLVLPLGGPRQQF